MVVISITAFVFLALGVVLAGTAKSLSVRVGGLSGSAQLSLHYDEALGSISTGVYTIKSWREEPQ